MKKPVPVSHPTKPTPGFVGAPVESGSAFIDARIKELGDWRGKTLAKVRDVIHEADPEIVEELKWVKPTSPGTPVFSHGGIVCTGETYKNVVKMTFAKGAALQDPSGLFNSSLEGNVRRAIDIHEGEKIDEAALKDLIRAAVATQSQGQEHAEAQAEAPASERQVTSSSNIPTPSTSSGQVLNFAKNAKFRMGHRATQVCRCQRDAGPSLPSPHQRYRLTRKTTADRGQGHSICADRRNQGGTHSWPTPIASRPG